MYRNSSVFKGKQTSLMKPEADFDNVYEMIEHAIEYAFEGRMQLKFYEFLKSVSYTHLTLPPIYSV